MLSLRPASSTFLRSHHQTAALLTRASTRTTRPSPSALPSSRFLSPPSLPSLPSLPSFPPASPPSSRGLASLLSFSSGALGSLCGVGGAVFLIPSLVRYLHLPQRVAAGNSLVAVTAVAATSAASFAGKGHIDWAVAAPLAAAATLLTPLGAHCSQFANPALLRKLLGGFMLVLAPAMPLRAYLDRQRDPPPSDRLVVAGPSAEGGNDTGKSGLLVSIGAAVGFGSGLLGISGGSLFTPLVAVTCPDASFRSVLGTSFAAMIVPTGIGALSYARMGCVTPQLLPPLVLGAMAGATVGSAAALNVPEETLRWVFAIIFTVLGTRVLRKPIKAPVPPTPAAAGTRSAVQAAERVRTGAQKMSSA